jgi:hypothetical protein
LDELDDERRMDVLTEVAKDFDAAFILNQRLSVLRKILFLSRTSNKLLKKLQLLQTSNYSNLLKKEENQKESNLGKKYPKARIVGKVYLRHRVW